MLLQTLHRSLDIADGETNTDSGEKADCESEVLQTKAFLRISLMGQRLKNMPVKAAQAAADKQRLLDFDL